MKHYLVTITREFRIKAPCEESAILLAYELEDISDEQPPIVNVEPLPEAPVA